MNRNRAAALRNFRYKLQLRADIPECLGLSKSAEQRQRRGKFRLSQCRQAGAYVTRRLLSSSVLCKKNCEFAWTNFNFKRTIFFVASGGCFRGNFFYLTSRDQISLSVLKTATTSQKLQGISQPVSQYFCQNLLLQPSSITVEICKVFSSVKNLDN